MFKRVLICAAAVAVAMSTTAPPANAVTLYRWKAPVRVPIAAERQGATVLQDGRGFTAGGTVLGFAYQLVPVSSAGVFNPAQNKWAAVAPMHVGRLNPSAVTLRDGRVLVAQLGDQHYNPSSNTYEIYDPSSNSWTASKNLLSPPAEVNGVLRPLNDGRVLLLNFFGEGSLSYDPVTDTWSPLAAPWTFNSNWRLQTATKLKDGRGLVTLQKWSGETAAYFFDPASNAWEQTTSPTVPYGTSQAALLGDGRVIFLCDFRVFPEEYSVTAPGTSMMTFDPVSATWSPASQPRLDMHWAKIAPTADGGAAVVGASLVGAGPLQGTAAAGFDPVSGTWTIQPPSVFGHLYATPLTLPNGIMPIDGGKFSEELVKVAAVKTPAALPTLP